MDEDNETIENLFGFEDISETESERENENVVNGAPQNKPEAGAEGQEEPKKRRIIRKTLPKLNSNTYMKKMV
ncbi:hypothetical protein PIROE2DRAFT_17388 [Piromyces sp. E2]|nr:hypothetical protein PIROE2DRAFT_17388 [Piromyces sp. E2]|eukprot:OUM57584.1 hypothetical protein PIROE2DRAFT_17388 [Piromyces sp. E2]